MELRDILFSVENGIATVTLNRPEQLNAFSDDMLDSFLMAIEETKRNDDIRVLVLTGAGRAFCAGGDAKRIVAEGPEVTVLDRLMEFKKHIHRIPLALMGLEKPVIASVNGAAVGAGCDLALMCDIRIASENARFGEVYSKVGLMPGDGGTYFLPRIVGVAKACELIFTGEIIDAQEALRIGMVNKVVAHAQLEEETKGLAMKLAKGPPLALQSAKRAIYSGLSMDLPGALNHISTEMAILRSTEDCREGFRAFLEKRQPHFQNR